MMGDSADILQQIKTTQRAMVQEVCDAAKKASFNVPKPELLMFGRESTEGFWRYLEQSGWDLENAVRLLQSAYEWQTKMAPSVAEILKETFTAMPGYLSLRQVGFDKLGRPVLYTCFSQNQAKPAELTVDGLIAHLTHVAEHAGRSSKQENVEETGRRCIIVLDCSGFDQKYILKPDVMLKVYQTLCLTYPAVVESIMVFHYNQEIRNAWSALKSSFDDSFSGKVRFVPSTVVSKTLSESFGLDLSQWLQAELKLNRETPLPAAQSTFYKKNAGHDPRGSPIYVETYVDCEGFPDGHKPHGGILYGPK